MLLGVLLLGLGLAFIVAEILFPSLGVLTVLAVASLAGALVSAFAESTAAGFQLLVAVAVLVPIVMALGFKLFPKSPFGRRMVAPGLSFEPAPGMRAEERSVLGREGVVESALRPAGIARIDGRRVDVVTRGDLLARGARVRVVEISGNRIVVAAVEETPPASERGPSGPASDSPDPGGSS